MQHTFNRIKIFRIFKKFKFYIYGLCMQKLGKILIYNIVVIQECFFSCISAWFSIHILQVQTFCILILLTIGGIFLPLAFLWYIPMIRRNSAKELSRSFVLLIFCVLLTKSCIQVMYLVKTHKCLSHFDYKRCRNRSHGWVRCFLRVMRLCIVNSLHKVFISQRSLHIGFVEDLKFVNMYISDKHSYPFSNCEQRGYCSQINRAYFLQILEENARKYVKESKWYISSISIFFEKHDSYIYIHIFRNV